VFEGEYIAEPRQVSRDRNPSPISGLVTFCPESRWTQEDPTSAQSPVLAFLICHRGGVGYASVGFNIHQNSAELVMQRRNQIQYLLLVVHWVELVSMYWSRAAQQHDAMAGSWRNCPFCNYSPARIST
jgi:hypothetical protein